MKQRVKSMIKNLIVTIGILSAATGLCLLLDQMDDMQHSDAYVSMVFILAVFLVSRMTEGYFYGFVASIYGVLTVNYFFTYPYFAFNFSLPGYPITMVMLIAVSMLTSALTTRMKRQEQARAEAEKEKMRSDLLRAISHDFRTPLTSIMGANAALSESGVVLDAAQRRELHQTIEDEAQWLRRIVENLLLVTRIPEGGEAKLIKSPEAMEEIIAAVSDKYRARFPALPVIIEMPEEVLICPMDALLIEQALLNLLQNAAMHAKGATYVKLTISRDQKHAKISVSDNGCGIRQEQVAKISRFREGRIAPIDAARATGIGLSVCDAIITAHGGTLSLANGANGGFCATIQLPLEG